MSRRVESWGRLGLQPLFNRARSERERFEQLVMPHHVSAYNLARWLSRNDHDAEDIVQESFVRALRYFGGFRGDNPRAWLLRIVRNSCYTWLKQHRSTEVESIDDVVSATLSSESAETVVLRNLDFEMLRTAIEMLPVEYREVVLLREMEGLSYKEIAEIADIPIGTVMSRLTRARERIVRQLSTASADGRAS